MHTKPLDSVLQLMEDIDAIVEEHSYYSNMSADKAEELIRVLCDAVCRNLPNQVKTPNAN